jgi:ribosomal protein S18 acetylase RimI-like enzyme
VGKKTEKPSIKTTLTVAGKGGTPNEKAVRQEDADDAAAEAGQKEKVATTTVKLGGKTEKTAMPDTAQTSHFQKLKKELASLKGKNDEQSQKRRVNILDELESYQEETAPTPEKIKSDRQAADEFLKKKLTESQIAGVAVRQQEEIPKEVVKDAVEAAPGTTAKELKAQKKFLIEHVDEAIKDAPEEIEGLDRKVQQINDINNKAKAAYDKAANLRHYKKDEDQVQKLFSEREAFHRQAREIQATIPSVTIEVPNDGNFTVYNDKATLKKFKEIVAKQFPTTPEKAKNLTQPSGKARGYRAPSELEEGIDFKLNGKPAYTNGHLLLLGETKAIPETLAKRWGGADKETNQENRERLAEQAKRLFAENAEKAKLPVGKIKFVAIDEKPYNPADKKNDFPYGVADYPIRGEKQSTTVLISGDVSNAISTDYYQHIIDHYPDATFKIGVEMSKGDNISPVGVYSKGKHAGIVMPWRSSDAVQIAREHMQEESASGKTESVKAPKQEEIKSEAPREAPKYASRDSDFTKISDYISKNYGSKVNIPAFTSKLREMVKSATITAENAEKVIARLKATGEVTIPKSQVLEIAAEEGSNVTRQIKAERSGDNLRVPESYGPLELEAFRLVEEDLGRTIAPSSRISPIQKQVAGEWEKFTGTKILFANSNNIPFDGAVPKKGYIIVSDALDTPQLLSKVIGHELFHNIEHVAKLSPELEAKYKNFSEIARRLITDAKVKEFMEVENKKRVNRLGMKQLETVEEAWSEYGAHILGDAIRDKRFYERMYQQDRNLFEKFVDYIVGVFKKLKILSPDVVESEYYSPEQAVRLINESSDLFAQYLRVKDDFGVVSGESAQGPAYSTKPNQKSLDSIVGKWEKLGVAIDAFDYRNKKNTRIPRQLLSINRIEVDRDKRKRGLGTMAMHDLTDFADENGLRIELSPDDSLGATSKGRLKEFYKRFGFVENKGRNKDFRTSATMYREAITAEGQPLYAAQGIAGKGMSKHDAIFEMKKLDIDFDNLENFVVVENEARLPENIQNDMLSKGLSGTIEGAYDADANAFYIIAGNIASEKRLQQVVQHELVHKGLRNVLGPRIEPIFTAIGKKYRNEIREIADEYNLNVNKKTEMLTAVDEFIARYGEEYKEQPLIKRMIAIVRSWLRNHGFTVDWSDNDILNLAGAALKAEGMGEGVRYSFAGKKAKGFNEAQGKFSDLADRQERFEIDDNKAELQNIKLDSEGVANRTILLSEVLSHAELFKAYPEFKSMLTNISIDPSLEESNGRFDEGTPDTKRYFGREPEITVNARNLEEAKDVLLHEIQHALQVRENFAKGGMPTVGGATELKDRFEEMQDEYNRLKKKLWAERTTRENARFGTLENEIRLLAKRLEGESVDRYRRLSGEEEARRVSARADMTAEERLGTPYERTDLREGEERIVRREGGVAESKESGKIPPMTPKKGAGEKPTEKNPVTPGSGNQVYRSRGPEDAQLMREEDPNGSLANYDKQSQREWLRGANPPSDGKITLYRATPEGKEIAAGDYVTSSRKYAEDHIKNNLGGEGKISQISATLDDIYPADGPGEFWYAPKNILTEKPESKPEGGKWTAKGWVVDFNPQPILDKYGLKNGDEDILQKFAGEGGFISDLSRSQGERYNGLEQQGFIERKHQDVGPGELMGQGFPAKEVDRMILTDRGRELLSGIKRVHREAEKKFFDQLASSDSPRSPQSGDQAALSRSFQEGEENVQGNEGLPESQPGMGEVYGEPGAGREGVNKLRPASVGSEQGDRREDRTTRGANGPILSNPSFRKWFGNSVVTVDGKAGSEPLVVYHGSPIKGFEQFDKNKINPYDPDGPYNGFYFTSDEKDARRSGDFPWGRPNTKGGGETRAYYLALQNPATRSYARKVANEIANTWEQKYPEARSLNDAVRMDLQTRGHDGIIHEPYFVPSKEEFERSGKVSLNKFGRELRKSEEYPGGVDLYSGNEHITGYTDFNEAADMNRHGVFIAFEPTQIKSATGNTGEFSPENPNILYSKARGAKVASEATEKLTPYSAKPENNIFTEIASNPKRFYRSYRQSFADNDLSKLERLIGLPHWIAKNFADFDRVMDVEEIRQENRDTLRNGLLSARIKKNKDGMHEFLALPKESKKKVEKYLLKSDKENRVMNPDELKGLDTESKSAYYSWKRAMDAALELRMQWLEKMNLLPYEDKSWFESLKNVTSQKGKKNRDKTKKQVLSSIPEDSHRAFNEAYNAVIFGRTEIAKMRRQIGRIKFYVPHQREGNYVVDVHDPRVAKPTEWNEKFMGPWKGRLIWSERSTNKVKGTETLLRLQQKFPGMKMSEYVSKQVPEEIYQAISEAAIERFVEGSLKRAESKEGVSPEAAHALRNALFETVTDDLRKRGWERHAIHRSETWVGGYETENLDKAFVDYMSGLSGSLTKMEAAYRYTQALKQIDKKKTELYAYAQNYVKNLTRNQTDIDRKVGKAKAAAFFMYITGKLSMVPIQLTQNFVTGIPQLGRYTRGAGRKYSKAMADVATQGRISKLSPVEQAALKDFHDKGLDQAKFLNDIMGQVDGYTKGAWNKVNRGLGLPFFAMEHFNRKSAFLAAYRVFENKKNIDNEKGYDAGAFKRATDFVHDTHFQMGRANKPELAAGPGPGGALLNAAYTFNSFSHNFVLSLADGFRTGNAKEGGLLALRSLFWLTILGGMTSIPWWDDFLDIMEKQFGWTTRATERKFLRTIGGETLETFGMHGLPALLGFDLSGSMKTAIPFHEGVSETAMGVYGGLLEKLSRGAKSFNRGDYWRAAEQWSPLFLENAMKGVRMYGEPATTPGGRIVYDAEGNPITLNAKEAAGQFFGIRPEKVSTAQAKRQEMINTVTYYAEQKQAIYDEFALANTAEKRARVMKKVRQFNSKVKDLKGAVPLITAATLRQSIMRKRRPDKRAMLFDRAVQ